MFTKHLLALLPHSIASFLRERPVLLIICVYVGMAMILIMAASYFNYDRISNLITSRFYSGSAYTLPKMNFPIVNADNTTSNVKLELSLGVSYKNAAKIQKNLPIIMDKITENTLKIKPEDLASEEGIKRVKARLLEEINKVSPAPIEAIYIRKLITP